VLPGRVALKHRSERISRRTDRAVFGALRARAGEMTAVDQNRIKDDPRSGLPAGYQRDRLPHPANHRQRGARDRWTTMNAERRRTMPKTLIALLPRMILCQAWTVSAIRREAYTAPQTLAHGVKC